MSSVHADDVEPGTTTTNNRDGNKKTSRCETCVLAGIGLFFFALFLLSAIFQHNDQGVLVWIIFYYALAVLALVGVALHGGLFVSHRQTGGGGAFMRALDGFCLALLLYAIVLAIISAVKLAGASPDDAGADAENLNDVEEKGFELGGAILGMLSAMFHLYSFRKAN
jgi:hypothetical protein